MLKLWPQAVHPGVSPESHLVEFLLPYFCMHVIYPVADLRGRDGRP